MSPEDLSQSSMLDLFRQETENQTQVMIDGLLALERDPVAADQLEICMRAAHSLKGAARIVGVTAGVAVTHVMGGCFVAPPHGALTLRRRQIDPLLRGVDLLKRIAQKPDPEIRCLDGGKKRVIY